MKCCKDCQHSRPIEFPQDEIQQHNPHECIRLPPNILGEFWAEYPLVPGDNKGCSCFEIKEK